MERKHYKNHSLHGTREVFVKIDNHPVPQLSLVENYKNGKRDGLLEEYLPNGDLSSKVCYKDDEETDMSYCEVIYNSE